MFKKISLIILVITLLGCKTTKKADCDAYGYTKPLKVTEITKKEQKNHKVIKNVR